MTPLATVRSILESFEPAGSSAAKLDDIRELEELAGVLAAARATATADYVVARKAEQRAAGMPARRLGRGLNLELGLARRVSPHRAGRDAGLALVLTSELPATFAAMRGGQTSEWKATLVARETGWLSAEDRCRVDAELGPRLHALGDTEVASEAARLAYALDPHGKIRAMERAAGGRHVSQRPLPDGMTRLSAVLPLQQGVAVYAALDQAAKSAQAAGDERGRGQVMADTLVERVTGQFTADGVAVRVNVVMTDQALVRAGDRAEEPATVSGYGPVPAPWVRDWLSQTDAPIELRRLFLDPAGQLITMETRSRTFTPAMGEFVRLRDQICSTPFCGAPIRQVDHDERWADGGPTSLINARGKCEYCNYASEAAGWQTIAHPDGTVTRIIPTGHTIRHFTRPPAAGPPAGGPPNRTDHILVRTYRWHHEPVPPPPDTPG